MEFTLQTRYVLDPAFEAQHPRDPHGRWADKPGGTATAEPGFQLDAHKKFVGTLPADLWNTFVGLNERSRDKVYLWGHAIDIVVNPETLQAAFSDTKDHDPMIHELEPQVTRERVDAYVRVSLIPDQPKGPGFLSVVPPWSEEGSEADRARREYRAVRRVLQALYQSGVPRDLNHIVNWASPLNRMRAAEAGGKETAMYAVDPAFETLHPRDPRGLWIDKPGASQQFRGLVWPTTGAGALPDFRLPSYSDRSAVGGPDMSAAAWLSPFGRLYTVGMDAHDDWARRHLGVGAADALSAGGVRLDLSNAGPRAIDLNVEATQETLADPVMVDTLRKVIRASQPTTGYRSIVLDVRDPDDFLTFDGPAAFFAALDRLQQGGTLRQRAGVASWHTGESDFTLRVQFAQDPEFEAKHPRERGGKWTHKPGGAVQDAPASVKPKRPLDIYMRPDDLERHQDWGTDIYWTDKNRPGVIVTRTGPMAWEDLPPMLYHVTVHLDAVESSGYLRGMNEGGGLGGGNGMAGVSFTTERADADLMLRELRRTVTLAHAPIESAEDFALRLDEYVAEDAVIGGDTPEVREALQKAKAEALANFRANEKYYREHTTLNRLAQEMYRSSYIGTRSIYTDTLVPDGRHTSPLRDPLLMAGNDAYMAIDPAQLGVVTVARDRVPRAALIRLGSDDFLHEVRVHADVPLRPDVTHKFAQDGQTWTVQADFAGTSAGVRRGWQTRKGAPPVEEERPTGGWTSGTMQAREGQAKFVRSADSRGLAAHIQGWSWPSIVINPETGETAAIDRSGGHENLLDAIGYKKADVETRDAFAHVEVQGLVGNAIITIVPPAGLAILNPEEPWADPRYARAELRAVKRILTMLARGGITPPKLLSGRLGVKIHWFSDLNKDLNDPTSGVLLHEFALDPDFEQKHPRGRGDQGGQFIEKPDAPADTPSHPRNVGSFRGQPFWIGVADATTGDITGTYPYEQAEMWDFHHNFYMTPGEIERIRDDEAFTFWFDDEGKLATFTPRPPDLLARVEQQITRRRTHAVDPEFEAKHPRAPEGSTQGGKFIDKPGGEAPVARGERGWIINRQTGAVLRESGVGKPVAEDWQSNVDLGSITDFDDQDILLVHTHPEQMSFSDSDWLNLVMRPQAREMQVVLPDGQVHTIRKPADYDWKRATPRKIREGWEQFENEIFDSKRSLNMTVEQIAEEINTRLAEMTGIEFSKTQPLHPAAAASLKMHALDPEFEAKHPRGPKGTRTGGKFVEKPDLASGLTFPADMRSAAVAAASNGQFLTAGWWIRGDGRVVDVTSEGGPGDHMGWIRVEKNPAKWGLTAAEATKLADSAVPVRKVLERNIRVIYSHGREGRQPHIGVETGPWSDAELRKVQTLLNQVGVTRGSLIVSSPSIRDSRDPNRVGWLQTDVGSFLIADHTYQLRHSPGYAVDPEFEAKHPRDPKGQWTEKAGEARVVNLDNPADDGLAAMKRDMMDRFGLTDAQAEQQLVFIRQVNARLAGPTTVEPTAAQALDTQPGQRFPGQCYEMAGRYILDHVNYPDAEDYTLVHGVIDQDPEGEVRIGHGWVETADGKVFDGTQQKWFDKASYYQVYHATVEQRYTAREARYRILASGNWGCWYESAGIVNNMRGTPMPSARRRKAQA